jgi:PQQ-like domain
MLRRTFGSGRRRLLALVVSALVSAIAGSAQGASVPKPTSAATAGWSAFGFDPAGNDAGPVVTDITAANVRTLVPTVVPLPGTVDSSAVSLENVVVDGSRRDVDIVDTTYGRTIAVDATTGTILWQFVPAGIASWEGSLEITTASPAVDPSLHYVYSASPDGKIHKLSVATGREVRGLWPATVTLDPTKEKISSSLKIYGSYVLAAVAGLSQKIGASSPRVGRLVEIDTRTGRVAHVFNSECSDRTTVIVASTCAYSYGGIWGRTPATVDPKGNLLVATGNGYWDGRTHWGDSVLELSPTLEPLQSYTPTDQAELDDGDLDLGSSAPTILTKHIVLAVGKDGVLRLLDLDKLDGKTQPAGPHLGGELSDLEVPGGGQVRTQPAVWQRAGSEPWVFVTNDYGVFAYALVLQPTPHLTLMWSDGRGSSSPVIAGGLLYAYDIITGGLGVYDLDPATGNTVPNEPLYSLTIPPGHRNTPVVVDGRIALGSGDSNDHATTGSLFLWNLPAR